MFGTTLREINQWLIENGYVRDETETRCYTYNGCIKCNQIDVPVRFSFYDLSFLELPDIYLREPRPEALCRPLPHVDHQNKLCYLEDDNLRLDPYQPLQTIVTLLGQAQRVLKDSVSGANSDDVGYEFLSYWEYTGIGVILSNHFSGNYMRFNVLEYISPIGTKHTQMVVGSSDEIDAHSKWRQGKLIHIKHQNAIWVNVTVTELLPESGIWPPKNFKAFYEWLKDTDSIAASKMYNMLGTKSGAHSPLLIVFSTPGGYIGIEIALPKNLLSAISSPGRFRKQLLIDNGKLGVKLSRIMFEDYSPKFQTSRNLPYKGLSGRHIVLIGCGNIGGYLARLLVQSGAGLGQGKLELYDGQIFTVGNIGRHYLDGAYLNENKAIACRHKLTTEFPTVNILAKSTNLFDVRDIASTDIIVDATGREIFSLSLNKQIVRLRKENHSSPVILYNWIDGNGCCGRTLFYDGTGGCYRCLQDASGNERFEPLSSKEDLIPMSYKCGESFVPYPPSASVQAAGMGLEAVLDWANGKPGHHFRNRRFHEKARQHKNKKLTRIKECPACQK
ncbi:MAG: ThiF family adenylyltransferase [Thiohalomonadales bacterium]